MLLFHPLTLDDKPWIDRHVREEDSRSADFNFGNMFLWDHVYHQMVADSDRHLVTLCRTDADPVFPFPIGCGDFATAVEEMAEYAAENDFPLVIRGLEERHVALLEQRFPGKFSITEDRDFADYLYDAEKLIALTGKKLHGKRNHINRFCAEHEWSFRALQATDREACMALLKLWTEEADETRGRIESEHRAIESAFRYFDALELFGGILFADGEIAGFTIGEKISSDTFDVHFEKARGYVNGAYPMVNREFVRMIRGRWPEIRYINREDDMGLENLRRSKLSYEPDLLLRKFTARRRDEA